MERQRLDRREAKKRKKEISGHRNFLRRLSKSSSSEAEELLKSASHDEIGTVCRILKDIANRHIPADKVHYKEIPKSLRRYFIQTFSNWDIAADTATCFKALQPLISHFSALLFHLFSQQRKQNG